jgi:acylphosphatase
MGGSDDGSGRDTGTGPEVRSEGWVVEGRVQGVGFRWWTREQARALGITGWVRNERDGSVHVQARGDRQALVRFRAALEEGPRGARVTSVTGAPALLEGVPERFEIRAST